MPPSIVEFEPTSAYDAEGVRVVAGHPAVRSCYKVTGRALLLLVIRVRDSTELNAALLEFNRFGQTHSSLVLSLELEHRAWFFGRLGRSDGRSASPKPGLLDILGFEHRA